LRIVGVGERCDGGRRGIRVRGHDEGVVDEGTGEKLYKLGRE